MVNKERIRYKLSIIEENLNNLEDFQTFITEIIPII